jgi:hypothetical protein
MIEYNTTIMIRKVNKDTKMFSFKLLLINKLKNIIKNEIRANLL